MTILNTEQELLLDATSAAYATARIAKNIANVEIKRRLAEANAQIQIDVEREIAQHEAELDEAIIAAIEGGVPALQIAIRAFGAKSPMGVYKRVWALRDDGRLNPSLVINNIPIRPADTAMPESPEVAKMISVQPPSFTPEEVPYEVAPGIRVSTVRLQLDARDPWFRDVADRLRPGTPFKRADHCILYRHPNTDEILAIESREVGDTMVDHPVARWALEHPDEVVAAFADLGL